MSDKIAGFLEVGLNDSNEIVVNHGKLDVDVDGVGHIVFSAEQARNLARILNNKATEVEWIIEKDRLGKIPPPSARSEAIDLIAEYGTVGSAHELMRCLPSDAQLKAVESQLLSRGFKPSTVEQVMRLVMDVPPVDRSARTLLDGRPVTKDHREINPSTGMQRDYIVLSAAERAKGFVRPVRRGYIHLTCGSVTFMGIALAETYARDPKFYSGTFCATCRIHFPLDQFVWEGSQEKLGE